MIAFDPKNACTELDPDTELMIRVAAGDRDAFDQLVRRHFASTSRIISAMMGTSVHSEDLAQDVFLRVYRSRQRYMPTARFTTWLGTITRNVVLNAKRTLARRRVFAVSFSDEPESSTSDFRSVATPSVEANAAAEIDRQEIVEFVRKAVAKLPQRQRKAIELVHFHGLTYSTAAEEMETTRKAVKSLLGRGRSSLLSDMQHESIRLIDN